MAGSEKRPGVIPVNYKAVGQNPDKGGQVAVGTGRKGPAVVTPTDRTPPTSNKPNPRAVGTGANQGGGKSPGRMTDKATKAKGVVGKRVVTKTDSSSSSKKSRSMGKMTGGY